MRKARVWIGLTAVALFVMMVGIGGEAKPAEPSDALAAELVFGSVAARGGALGGYVGFSLFLVGMCYKSDDSHSFSYNHCSNIGDVSILGLPVGMILGATFGVRAKPGRMGITFKGMCLQRCWALSWDNLLG